MSRDRSQDIYLGKLDKGGPSWTRCVSTTLAVVLIIGIVLVFLVIAWLVWVWRDLKHSAKVAVRKGFAKSVYNSCTDMVDLGKPIALPSDLLTGGGRSQYQPKLSAYLFRASLETTRDSCLRTRTVSVPLGFTDYRELSEINSFDDKERPVATAYWSVDQRGCMDTLMVCFNGTKFMDQWITDIQFRQLAADQLNNYLPGMMIHKGFYQSYLGIRSQLLELLQYQPNTYLITGHSLGGATSTIAALDTAAWNPIHYSFASPCVGNPVFAKQYHQLLPYGQRVINLCDAIPELPLPVIGKILYQHVANLIHFSENLGTVESNHIDAYVNNLLDV